MIVFKVIQKQLKHILTIWQLLEVYPIIVEAIQSPSIEEDIDSNNKS